MPIEIRMPRLTESMTEGVVVAWRKREGEPVRAGDVIAEIQADKTTVDFEAPEDGTLARIMTPAGSEAVEVGDVLAFLLRPGEAPARTAGGAEAAAPAFPSNGNSRQEVAAEPAPAGARPEPAVAEPAPTATAVASEFSEFAPTATAVPAHATSTDLAPVDVEASPLARSMAAQAGIDLSRLRRNGHTSRITMAEVLAELGADPQPGNASPRDVATAPGPRQRQPETDAPYDELPHSRMRQVIAQRLGESKQTIPHFYLTSHCEIDGLLRLKAELQSHVSGDLKLSINDFLIRAAALALRAVPEANAAWTDRATRLYRRMDLAVAVATPTGLLTPIIRDAGRKGLAEIASEVRDLAARARSGKLRADEYQGGTFTISNLGMYDVDEICAIVNPPQSGILGVGAARPRPVVRDGAVVVATMMTCTLSADHRVLDGAVGAKFLSTFKALVERPATMIL